jgi:predicted signal transduction protein with EAL and GGDEF domain
MKTTAERMLANADEALYRAKLGGRGRAATSGVRVVVRPTERAAA